MHDWRLIRGEAIIARQELHICAVHRAIAVGVGGLHVAWLAKRAAQGLGDARGIQSIHVAVGMRVAGNEEAKYISARSGGVGPRDLQKLQPLASDGKQRE